MTGFLLVLAAAFFAEIGDSIGKREVNNKRESIYTFGFLIMLWGTVFLFALGFLRDSFVFSAASLPTLSARIILEIVQAYISVLAIAAADRSTFGFLRILTLPLLLGIDVFLGYTISSYDVWGIGIIITALAILFINHGIRRAGAGLVLISAVNAAITLSLFKYNITHYNSVELEQGIVHAVLLVYFFIMAIVAAKENPLLFLKRPVFLGQSIAAGLGVVLYSFAYLFAPASIITTIKRAATILWAMIFGNVYFKEKKFLVKTATLILIVTGLVFLVI